MTTAAASLTDIASFTAEIRARANALFTTRQHQRLMNVPLTRERARLMALQMFFWINNRRDCWAFAQGLAPLDVKAMIWEHERDELAGNAERGVEDHGTLTIKEGAVLGLTPDDYRDARMLEGTRTCLYAWIHLVKDSHWLKSVSACAALEIQNSSEWVDGGGLGYRMGKQLERALGIPFEKQISAAEHAEVDVDHAHMLLQIAKRHATTPQQLELMLEGITESWELLLVWQAQLAEMMEALP
jgi:pyrroloquinoline quinone (PQQ) biosynthesis protein C